MIACLPFFPNAGGADWLAPEAAALLGQTLAGLARLEGVARVALYTDSARAAALASGLEVVRCSAPRSASLQGRVAELLGDKLDGGTAVLGLDPRNPFLHPDDVYGALRLHAAAPDTPVLSVAVPRDHPAQLRQYYDVPAAGLVLRFDPEPPEEARELARGGPVSREFPLAWGEAVPEADTLSLDAAGRPDLDGGDSGSVLLRTGRGTARLVWRGATADGNVLGASFGLDGGRPAPPWLVLGPDGVRLALPGIADGEARLAPLTGDGLEEGHWLVPSLADGSARLEDSDAPGFLYAVERGCRGGSYGFTRPFDPGAAWSAERHATADGKPITGRQSLPDVLVPDGSLCLGRLDDLARLEHGGGAGGARLLRLPPERSWAADTPLELLRRVVRRRMAEGGPDAG